LLPQFTPIISGLGSWLLFHGIKTVTACAEFVSLLHFCAAKS